MKTEKQYRERNACFPPLLFVAFLLISLQHGTAEGASPFKPVPYDGDVDYVEDTDSEDAPDAGAEDADGDQDFYDEPPVDGSASGASAGGASEDNNMSFDGEVEGYHECLILKGERCYTLPDSSDDAAPDDATQRPDTEPMTAPDSSHVPSPYEAGGPFGDRSKSASPYTNRPAAFSTGGAPGGPSAYPNRSHPDAATYSGRAVGGNPDEFSAACAQELQSAGSEYLSCSQNASRDGMCQSYRALTQCGERFMQSIQYSACPASIKRSNIDGVRSVSAQLTSNSSSVCAN